MVAQRNADIGSFCTIPYPLEQPIANRCTHKIQQSGHYWTFEAAVPYLRDRLNPP